MQSGHDDTSGQFCGAQMERGTEHFGRLRRTGHPLRVGDKERGTLPVRSKTFGTDGSRTTAVQGCQISCDDNTAGCRGWSDAGDCGSETCFGSSSNSRSRPSLTTVDGMT